ncbi:sulfurtransferase [Microbacterium sp. KUDC0406]|uniref:rhodanese-like domain-containing protein n=1 Tax=Microbacterium sp. KUDC0406 TaxID=2909588 RepID=UPI001F165B08|nr:rhodanese-like domain-containing protein [Microbacterium sp. KUDC0406]UJP10771.1 sulfurtransferase [Microbacterium sp. KUDC0406]
MDRTDYFTAKLAFETDPSDVYTAQKAGEQAVIVDVRSAEAWAQGRVAGAVHMHYSEIADRAPREIPAGSAVVVYCWSPGCNAGAKGALEFAKLGYEVREMIGGFEYWVREGFPIENADGVHRRPIDPNTNVPRIRTRA